MELELCATTHVAFNQSQSTDRVTIENALAELRVGFSMVSSDFSSKWTSTDPR